MAEVFGRKHRRIPVSQSDIDQAILVVNNKLKKQNQQLSDKIANKEESLASLKDDAKSTQINLDSILQSTVSAKSTMENAQEKAQIENAKIGPLVKKVSEAIDSERNLQLSMDKIESIKEKLQKQSDELKESIDVSNQVLSFAKAELKELGNNKDKQSVILNQVLSDIRIAKQEQVSENKLLKDNKEKHKILLKQLNSELSEVKSNSLLAVKSYNKQKNKLATLDKLIVSKEKQINKVDEILVQKVLDQTELDLKYKIVSSKLEVTKKKTDQEIERAKHEKQVIKTKFKDWKVSILDDIARLKLKGKLDIIDKANLSEILNG